MWFAYQKHFCPNIDASHSAWLLLYQKFNSNDYDLSALVINLLASSICQIPSLIYVLKFMDIADCFSLSDKKRWNYKACCTSSLSTVLDINKWFKPPTIGEYISVRNEYMMLSCYHAPKWQSDISASCLIGSLGRTNI